MYYQLFACNMYDFYGVDLCTMYDSYGVYLHVLWTIYMYKFSRYYTVVFHEFSFPMPVFWVIRLVFYINRPEIARPTFGKSR
jgi:hypothetical protein